MDSPYFPAGYEERTCSDAAYLMAQDVYKTKSPTPEQVNRCEDVIEQAAEEWYENQGDLYQEEL